MHRCFRCPMMPFGLFSQDSPHTQCPVASLPSQHRVLVPSPTAVSLPGDPRDALSFWRLGICWVFPGDGQPEGITVTKRAARRFPSEPWNVPTAVPVPLTAGIHPQSGEGGGRQGIAVMGWAHGRWRDIPEMGREPEQRWTSCGSGCRERAAQPGPGPPSPPGPPPRPGSPSSASPLRGLHCHLPALGWQGVS